MATLPVRSSLQLLLAASMLGASLSACSSHRSSTTSPQPFAADMGERAEVLESNVDNQLSLKLSNTVTPTPHKQPQLVKRGTLSLTVDSVKQTIEQITTIARQQQGDLLQLQDELPNVPGAHHTASLEIRVPQQNLEVTLKAIAQIGTVKSRAISAEDVSSQLIDHQARLRNLRKTETTLLEIMNRSGNVADVLKVAQELSNVRNSIEQADAQVKDLQNQVAFSTVTIDLQQATTTLTAQPQVQTTWQQATQSVGNFTVRLMQLGLWLLAYSPYLLVLLFAAILIRRWRSPSSRVSTSEPPSQ